MAETAGDNILIFKTPDDEWGEFSNRYPAPFTYMGIRFETVEQFLYYMKAVFGRSRATADKVLACGGDSSALSKVSRKQRILDNNSWEIVRPQMMRIGMRQKFLQNPELRKKLLSTGFRLLVEIPKEGILGKILPASEEWVRDPGKWKGRNQTGKALMQVRTDLRCANRLVEADEVYVFPKEPFILQTPIGQMTLREISMLPGARESVRAYAETAQQYIELFLANAEGFINRNNTPLVKMERSIANDAAEIEKALNRARTAGENTGEVTAEQMTETAGGIDAITAPASEEEAGADAALELSFGTPAELQSEAQPGIQPEIRSEDAADDLPGDIPAEGFYELLYDLDEMMKLGII